MKKKYNIFLLAIIILMLISAFFSYASVPDDDGDQVPNCVTNNPNEICDKCPNTPQGQPVDKQFGCSCEQKTASNCPGLQCCSADNNPCTDDCSISDGKAVCNYADNNNVCNGGRCSNGKCIQFNNNAASAAVSGEVRVNGIVIGVGLDPPPVDVEGARNLLFGEKYSAKDFYRENSFGKISITGDVKSVPSLAPTPETVDCDHHIEEIIKYVISSADHSSVKFEDNQYIVVFYPHICADSELRGMVALGKTDIYTREGMKHVYVAFIFVNSWKVVAHELGHNFGLGHSIGEQEDINNGNCKSCCYGDYYTVMGSPQNPGHINALHKEAAGWLTDTKSVTYGDYELKSLESDSGTRLLNVKSSGGSDLYSLSLRQRIGYDKDLYNGAFAGVSMHKLIDTTCGPSTKLLNHDQINGVLLQVDRPFTDTQNNIRITVKSTDSGGASASISIEPADAPPSSGSLTISPNSVSLIAGHSSQSAISGGTPPYSIQTPPNGNVAQAALDVNVVNIRANSEGSTLVTIQDSSSPVKTASVAISVTNPIPPSGQPSLTVVFPNGGERLETGSQQNIRWSSALLPASAMININLLGASGSSTIITNTPNDDIQQFTAPSNSGSYKIELTSILNDGQTVSDQSDSTFEVIPATNQNNQPQITSCSPASASITVGGIATLNYEVSDPDGDALTLEVNWGDGVSGAGGPSSATHVYQSIGTKSITLTARDSKGASANSPCGSINVDQRVNRPPTISACTAPNTQVRVGENAMIQYTISDPDDDNLDIKVNWGDGTITSGGLSSSSHVYSSSGSFNVKVTAEDGHGAKAENNECTTIRVTPLPGNNPPAISTCSVQPSGMIQAPISVNFAVTDPEGDQITSSISWGDGSTSQDASSSAQHTYSSAGTFDVILTATDSKGASSSRDCGRTIISSSRRPQLTITPVDFIIGRQVSIGVENGEPNSEIYFSMSDSNGHKPFDREPMGHTGNDGNFQKIILREDTLHWEPGSYNANVTISGAASNSVRLNVRETCINCITVSRVSYIGDCNQGSTITLKCISEGASQVKLWAGECRNPSTESNCLDTVSWWKGGILYSNEGLMTASGGNVYTKTIKITQTEGTAVAATCRAYTADGDASNWGDAYPLCIVGAGSGAAGEPERGEINKGNPPQEI